MGWLWMALKISNLAPSNFKLARAKMPTGALRKKFSGSTGKSKERKNLLLFHSNRILQALQCQENYMIVVEKCKLFMVLHCAFEMNSFCIERNSASKAKRFKPAKLIIFRAFYHSMISLFFFRVPQFEMKANGQSLEELSRVVLPNAVANFILAMKYLK